MIDEPQVFQIEFNEIGGFLYIQTLGYEDVIGMPFDGSSPAPSIDDAQNRINWALQRCVRNLEEVKEEIRLRTDDTHTQATIILMVYQSCVAINPSIDMAMWNYMIRQNNIYHDLFDAKPVLLQDPSDLLISALNKDLMKDLDLGDLGLDNSFLPDITPPPWADNLTKKKKKRKEEDSTEEGPKLNVKNILTLENHMNHGLIGQHEAVAEISKTLKRAMAGLKDERRPLGVFLFCGSSGVGKTHAAKLIQEHLFGKDTRIVRVDCGEYQQKHDSMKLLGSPSSYVGYEDGGQLTNAIKESQNTVLLLDEAEKAHRDFWDVFLKVFDEGYLTDNHGDHISFENTVVIMTSNLGNEKIAQASFTKSTGFNASIEDTYNSIEPPAREFVERETKAAINKFFKPEFVNRLDDIVIFNYLSGEDLEKVAKLELKSVSDKVHKLDYGFRWTKTAEKALAYKSQRAISGAREIAKVRRNLIENELAHNILEDDILHGTTFVLSAKKIAGSEDYDFILKREPPAIAAVST